MSEPLPAGSLPYHKDGAAQNSVAALAKAQELGIYGSEFDVWITADGKVHVALYKE